MKKKENIPEIRFSGFTDLWEQRKFAKVFEKISNNTFSRAELNYKNGPAKNIHYGDVLIKFGELLDLQKDDVPYINKNVVINQSNSSRLKVGDIIIADAAEDETVGKCTELVNIEHQIVYSGLHTIPSRPILNFASGYLGFFINSSLFHSQLLRLMQGTKVSSISKSSLQNTDIFFPLNVDEQLKISNLLQDINNLITLHQRKYDKLKLVKKSLLEKMFPKNGETVPAIRFKGFTDTWEQRKLGEIADIVGGGTPSTNIPEYWDGDIDWYSPTEIGEDAYAINSVRKITKLGLDKSSAIMLPVDKTILFTSRAGIGKLAILKHPAATNQGFQSIVLKENNHSYFVYSMGNIIKHKAEVYASGSTFLEISGKELAKIQISITKTEEQIKIGECFKNLDNLITLHQRELEKLKKIKKSLLEKMFV